MHDRGVVLMVEDNEDILMGTTGYLELKQYTVHTAKTLAEARRSLAEPPPPDVILLDVNLPDGDGIDFCGEIRDRTGAYIYFYSANSRRDVILRGLESGGDGYIKKPCDMDVLCAHVEAALRRRRMPAI